MKDKRACVFGDEMNSKPCVILALAPLFDKYDSQFYSGQNYLIQAEEEEGCMVFSSYQFALYTVHPTSLSCIMFTLPACLVYCSQDDPRNQIPAASASVDFLPWFPVLLDEMLHMGKYLQSIL
jgi:hypothetical protein